MIPWRIAIFGLLGLVLLGGFAWYERSRPGSRTVALVAALAALAVAGRLAFAAIPNVQATTDVVLITGFAVGAAPGFAVGALGALISNFWLGQGPWTPWEMVGWGLVGVAGAGLAVLTRHRPGRLGLALACGLAGLAYGALLDYSVMATSGGAQTLDRYLAISARGVPFNVAHAVGNFVLALAAGPALVRIIRRYRDRMEFTWRPEWAAPLALVAVLAGAFAAATPRAEASGATTISWLGKARNHDGGFGVGPGTASSPEMTGWAMLGLEAAGRNPLDVGKGKSSPPSYLRRHASQLTSTGDLERTILALHGAGINPHNFSGVDLVAKLHNRRRHNGSYSAEVNLTAFGIMAMRASGHPSSAVRKSRQWLERTQNADGGWGFEPGVASDADSTGAALQGLAAASAGKRRRHRGALFLSHDQNRDGGWPIGGGGPSNSQSSAWALQGLVATGRNPGAVRAGGHSGLDYLAKRRTPNGHYRYSAHSDQTPVWVTGQVLMAVKREALPIAAVARTQNQNQSQGGGGSGGGGGDSGGGASGSGGSSAGGSGSGSGGTSTPPVVTPSPTSSPSPSTGAIPSISSSGLTKKHPAKQGEKKTGSSAHAGAPPAPAKAKAKATQGEASPSHQAAPAKASAGEGSPSGGDSGSSDGGGGTPIWLYVAGGAALLALLWGGGVWWYRSGGWVPPLPGLR